MREEVVTAVRYSFRLRREVAMRLIYEVRQGPRPDIVRWFLVRTEGEASAETKPN
jgi:hypothetical protein